MYCGDETGSFIGDIGSHSCRFGYGGEDNPKLVTPSYISNQTSLASGAVSSRVAAQELESVLRRPEYTSEGGPLTDPNAFLRQGDLVENWDAVQTAWENGMHLLHATDTLKHTKGGTPYSSTTKTTPGEGKCVHPILAVMPGYTQFDGYGASYCAALRREQYTKSTELFMETLEASSLFLAPSPMLAAFSMGRQTALVVDIGAGGTRVTPVVDGLVLQHAQRRNGRGGDWLGHVTWKALLDGKINPKPRYLLRDSKVVVKSPLFHPWAMQELMYELRTEPFVQVPTYSKGRVPFSTVSMDVDAPPPSPSTPSSVSACAMPPTLELPDGTSIDLATSTLGDDLTNLPELLFTDTLPFSDPGSSASSPSLRTIQDMPLHQLINESLLAVGDVDVRTDLSSNILLCGGSSLFPGVDARLSYELAQSLPAFAKAKVVAPKFSVERSCAPWIGASILSSLGSFQQLWLSRAEYEEYGPTLAIQRFP
eukprot:Nitzschia sp. Nitz4//scaffold15_size197535//51029//52471//NITZ4_001566-RA/size197535-processed-gene-0.62-mRNA-1//-1//CDS//3329537679//5646//frame0